MYIRTWCTYADVRCDFSFDQALYVSNWLVNSSCSKKNRRTSRFRHLPISVSGSNYWLRPWQKILLHSRDIIMGAMASQITSLAIVYATVYSGADYRKHQTPRYWPLWGEFTGDRWIPRTNSQLRGKCFRLMTSSCFKFTVIEKSCAPFQYTLRRFSVHMTKSPNREIGCLNVRIVLKFDRRLGSTATESSVKFQDNTIIWLS